MAGERRGHSLQATALVNEAYVRLLDVQHVSWQNRAHFLAMAARLMRCSLSTTLLKTVATPSTNLELRLRARALRRARNREV